MAAYPCQIGNHRYAGSQRSVYVSEVSSARPETYKLRLCPRHFLEVSEECALLLDRLDEEQQMSLICQDDQCAEPREGGLFVRLYSENGEEPAQFAGDFCGRCLSARLKRLHVDVGLPVRG